MALAAVQWALARGLRPLERMASTVDAMDINNLGQRLDEESLSQDLSSLPKRLNQLLSRLQAGLDRERRLTIGAAHELRTPVADLRTSLEVACARPRSQPELEATLRIALSSTVRLSNLIHTLMRLARLGSGRESLEWQTVDIGALTREAVEEFGAESRTAVTLDIPGPVMARVDESLLRIALGNLLRNALEYRVEGSMVQVAVIPRTGTLAIEIKNRASRLNHDHISKIGEPFWRRDASRSDQGHLGLGVHLARSIAQAMAGDVLIEETEAGTVRATIWIPVAR